MTYPTMPRPDGPAVPVNDSPTEHARITLVEVQRRTDERLTDALTDITATERRLEGLKATAVELESQSASLAAGIAALMASR